MDIMDRVDQAAGVVYGLTKFSSGQDSWYFEDSHEKRQALIDAARDGSKKAIKALKGHPYNIKTLILGGVKIV